MFTLFLTPRLRPGAYGCQSEKSENVIEFMVEMGKKKRPDFFRASLKLPYKMEIIGVFFAIPIFFLAAAFFFLGAAFLAIFFFATFFFATFFFATFFLAAFLTTFFFTAIVSPLEKLLF